MSTLRSIFLSSSVMFALFAGAAAQAETMTRFTVSADGQEVTDSSTKLVWKRCAEGMNWNGKTCAGKAKKVNWATARDLGKAAAGTPAWRLPVKEEMVSLMDKKGKKMVFDKLTFPAAPVRLFWAVRPESTDNLNQWLVDTGNGHVFGNTRAGSNYVRLVRSAP